jgi:hypothetical protein
MGTTQLWGVIKTASGFRLGELGVMRGQAKAMAILMRRTERQLGVRQTDPAPGRDSSSKMWG